MWSEEMMTGVEAIGLFVGLSFVYRLIFRVITWQSPLVRALTKRTRLSAYVLVPLLTLLWIVRQVLPPLLGPSSMLATFTQFTEYALSTVLVLFVVESCSAFIFDYVLAVRYSTIVPDILRAVARGIVYTALFLFLLPQVLAWRDVAALATSSAIVSLILGLALQETLGNFFAGIGMQLSRPYITGQWVKIGTCEGVVERADWRSATLRTREGDLVSFPHSLVAKMEIHNFSVPTPFHACEVAVGVDYRHPPSRIDTVLLRCAYDTTGVCHEPPAEVRLHAYQDSSIQYMLRFWVSDFGDYETIQSNVLKRIWYQFKREKIQIPFPIQNL
ncbi:MAG: mechanosensitive ion channel [Deltaproteobacteria bacterium]|nr:mechanosensitive ion channel [Deltaproteobacteria bacterium]